jgi:hypothetical protein
VNNEQDGPGVTFGLPVLVVDVCAAFGLETAFRMNHGVISFWNDYSILWGCSRWSLTGEMWDKKPMVYPSSPQKTRPQRNCGRTVYSRRSV